MGGGERRLAECRGSASQCVSDRVGGLVCRFGSFWRRWVRCAASGLSGSHARWERRIVVCESEGVGGLEASATLAAVSSGWPEARPVSQPREPARGGDDLKGPESRLNSRAKLGEPRGEAAPLAGSVLARSGVCSYYWLEHAALGGAGAPALVCSG